MSRENQPQASQAVGEEHVAVALHAVRVSQPRPSDSVAIVGDGPLALATVAVLLARGVGKVVLLARAGEVGARASEAGTRVVSLSASAEALDQARAKLSGYGPDFVFECEGSSETRRLAIDLVRPAGMVVLVADEARPTSMSPNLLVFGDKRVLGSHRFDDEDLQTARNLIEAGRLCIDNLDAQR